MANKYFKYSHVQFLEFQTLAEQEDVNAQEILGNCYRYNQAEKVNKNYKLANFWYEKAIENGSCVAMYEMGVAYAKSATHLGKRKDSKKAIELLLKAKELGDYYADFFLGLEYEKIGDIDNAIACFNAYLLLKPYDEVVLAHLGKLYFKTQQYDHALIILSKAHDDRSKLLLSKMYRKGLGVDQDKKLARDIRKRVSFFKRESIPIIIVFLVSMIIGFFTPTYIIPGVKILAGRCYKDSENYKSNYGYQYLSSLNKKMANLYRDMYYVNVGVSHSNASLKKNKKDHKNDICTFHYGLYGLSFEEAMFATDIFVYDNAQFFWIVNETYSRSTKQIDLINDWTNASKKQRNYIAEELAKKDKEVDDLMRPLANESELVRVSALYDYVLNSLTYATDENYEAVEDAYAYTMEALVGGKGVCAAYSKVFTYYCNKYHINCLPVIGKVSDKEGIGHAWNLVELENQWYVFDITSADGYSFTSTAYRNCFALTIEQYNEFIWSKYDVFYGYEDYSY